MQVYSNTLLYVNNEIYAKKHVYVFSLNLNEIHLGGVFYFLKLVNFILMRSTLLVGRKDKNVG